MRGNQEVIYVCGEVCVLYSSCSPTNTLVFYPRASIMTLRWQDKLKPSGLYYDGFISGKELNDVLENHRRDTASTFGTRKSSNISAVATTASASKSSDFTTIAPNSDENVNKLIEKLELILVHVHVYYYYVRSVLITSKFMLHNIIK